MCILLRYFSSILYTLPVTHNSRDHINSFKYQILTRKNHHLTPFLPRLKLGHDLQK